MTAMVQVIRPPRCPICGTRCGKVDHYPEHWLESCRRKVTYISASPAVDHALELTKPAFVYECPLPPRVHFHVASGRFHGWHRHNHRKGA